MSAGRGLALASILALLACIAIRALGPSDAWDQTQPKTISYSTDIVVNGHWILPTERGVQPATKPPLYNWFAAPAVRWLGFASDPAHRWPSVLALGLCWLLVVRIGQAVWPQHPALGWLAGLALVCNYMMFKLGYLARPDMLLTLWLLIAWACVTTIYLRPRAGFALQLALWIAVGLAALTKGPPALSIMLFALVAARPLAGRWSAVHRTGWWWGVPLSLAIGGAWLYAAWRVDPEHVRVQLWEIEIWGRLTGTGPEGGGGGFVGWLTSLPNMPLYYLTRFLPWSIFSIIAAVMVLGRNVVSDERERTWLRSSIIVIVLTIALYSLSAGKRADYIALAFGPGALLAAWLLGRCDKLAWSGAGLGVATLVAMGVVESRTPAAPAVGFSREVEAFIDEVAAMVGAEPHPLVTWNAGPSHVGSFLGLTEPDVYPERREWGRGLQETTWVVAGRRTSEPWTLEEWAVARRMPLTLESRLQSPDYGPESRHVGWHEQLTLYLVKPGPRPR